MNITTTLQRHARQYVDWLKRWSAHEPKSEGASTVALPGKSSKNAAIRGSDLCWQSAYAAMSFVDHKYREGAA